MNEDKKVNLLNDIDKRISYVQNQLRTKESLAFYYPFIDELSIQYYNRWVRDSNALFVLSVNLKKRREKIAS